MHRCAWPEANQHDEEAGETSDGGSAFQDAREKSIAMVVPTRLT